MKVEKIILDNDNPIMVVHYENGDREVKEYPPKNAEDKALVEKFGGHYEISRATYQYNKDQTILAERFDKFIENQIVETEHFAIDRIMSDTLTKEQLMKLKLSMFDHEFVKRSKNRELLTSIRTSEDPIDLIMYFGMLRKEDNGVS